MESYQSFEVKDLHCYGCAHSAGGQPFPGSPSGERPCHFCIRNPANHVPNDDPIDKWYDGSEPVSVPMDCYHTVDMKNQFEEWDRRNGRDGIRWIDSQ
jgi:hypothetical protein